MKKSILLLAIIGLLFSQCDFKKIREQNQKSMSSISSETTKKVIKTLVDKYGKSNEKRIERGVNQSASLWMTSDGSENDFEKFCSENFIGNEKELEVAFNKISRNFESLWGNFGRISLSLREPLALDGDPITPIDQQFGAYDASSHLNADMFNNKLAFNIILNFPSYSLNEKIELGKKWSRKEWAYARLGDVFTSRVPSELILKNSEVLTASDSYISEYNIYVGNLVDDKGKTYFPKDMKLISHWNLRDELKSNYNNKEVGLFKQKMIYEVMKRIIYQDIPQCVVNKNEYQWNPFLNKIYKNGKEENFKPEPNTRYEHLLADFKIQKEIDVYQPQCNTFIKRSFDEGLEMPLEEIEKLYIDFISAPQVKQVAALIKNRLCRNLEPFDLWYDGFKTRSSFNEDDLTKKTQAKFPNVEAIQKDLPNLLLKLGFTKEKAEYIASKVQVDAARGSGHALGATMRGDKAHLRSRVKKTGLDYKGYNIGVHEFGHNVEQTISMNDVDNYMMNGVPNTAFTEALAFVFQSKDLELLDIKEENPDKKYLETLDLFWACYEIMGVSLVDQNIWKWMYENPNATPQQLNEAVVRISKEIWNKYYANVFGVKDQPILAIYSHMIEDPLYLSAYPIGHLIEFQLEKQFEGKNIADEIIRIFSYGRTTPNNWLQHATGMDLSTQPMIQATDEALKHIN